MVEYSSAEQFVERMTVDDNHNWDVIGKHILSTCGLKMELLCQRHADGNQLVVDLLEHYEPCMSSYLSSDIVIRFMFIGGFIV